SDVCSSDLVYPEYNFYNPKLNTLMKQRMLWLMVLLLPSFLHLSAQTRGSVTGTVKTETGEAVAGASVTAENSSSKSTTTVISNVAGAFTFSGLAGGSYTFTVSYVGYSTETITGTIGDTGLQLEVVLKV